MAKDLIKKGTELGDKELILMGQQMLEKHQEPEVKVDFTKDETPDADIELEPPIDKTPPKEFQYICDNCGCECSFDKERKRCPNCRKHKLVLSDIDAETEELPEGIARVFDKDTPKLKVDEDGNVLGKYAQPQPIDLSKTKHNRFNDDLNLLSDDPEDQYLRTKPISPRTRQEYKPKQVLCTRCGKKESVNPLLVRADYVCNKCLARRRA